MVTTRNLEEMIEEIKSMDIGSVEKLDLSQKVIGIKARQIGIMIMCLMNAFIITVVTVIAVAVVSTAKVMMTN